MRSISGKDLARILERNGWTLRRVHGSHHIYGKPDTPVRLSVPVHGNSALKVGLLKHLVKRAGLTEADLD